MFKLQENSQVLFCMWQAARQCLYRAQYKSLDAPTRRSNCFVLYLEYVSAASVLVQLETCSGLLYAVCKQLSVTFEGCVGCAAHETIIINPAGPGLGLSLKSLA